MTDLYDEREPKAQEVSALLHDSLSSLFELLNLSIFYENVFKLLFQ